MHLYCELSYITNDSHQFKGISKKKWLRVQLPDSDRPKLTLDSFNLRLFLSKRNKVFQVVPSNETVAQCKQHKSQKLEMGGSLLLPPLSQRSSLVMKMSWHLWLFIIATLIQTLVATQCPSTPFRWSPWSSCNVGIRYRHSLLVVKQGSFCHQSGRSFQPGKHKIKAPSSISKIDLNF